jgi:ribonuclease-3
LAFLHRSASLRLPDGNVVNNERLEFLGDAIIDAVIADYLFRKFPSEREGFLTRMRSKIVNRAHLDSIANQMGLVQVVVAYATNTESIKKRICGDAFEALVGAMYLDKGYEKTHKYLTQYVLAKYVNLERLMHTETDFKSRLIEWGQKYKLHVSFGAIEEYKDDSESKYGGAGYFYVQVTIANVPVAKGSGKSKKGAEQDASRKALTFLSTSTDFSTDALVQYLERIKERQ